MNVKNFILIPLLIIVVVAMSGCIVEGGNSFEKNGVRFSYPDGWQEVKSTSEGSIAAIAHGNDSSISILIQQVPSEYGTTIDEAYANTSNKLQQMPGYVNVQENATTIDNKNYKLHRYIVSNQTGAQKEHIASWVKMSDGKLYVVLYSTPVENYEQYKGAYDKVVSSFALESDKEDSIIDQVQDMIK